MTVGAIEQFLEVIRVVRLPFPRSSNNAKTHGSVTNMCLRVCMRRAHLHLQPKPAATVAPPASSSPIPAAATAPAATASPAVVPSTAAAAATEASPNEDHIRQLTDMGFPEDQARAALRAAMGNPDVAVEFLMTGIPDNFQVQMYKY